MLTANERVAAEAERILGPGPMSWLERQAEHIAWLAEAFGEGRQLLKGLYDGPGTECAVFVAGCLIHGGVQAHRGPPHVPAITTWLGVRGFAGERSWRSLADLEAHGGPLRGDILYWAGGPGGSNWQAATNGHVGVCLGDGWTIRTAEGGGSPGGTGCRLSTAPKDIRSSWGRPLRGVWRPNAMPELAVTPDVSEPTHRTLRLATPRMTGLDVETLQLMLGGILADGVFGRQTEARVREYQQQRGLLADGVVGPKTWAALEKP